MTNVPQKPIVSDNSSLIFIPVNPYIWFLVIGACEHKIYLTLRIINLLSCFLVLNYVQTLMGLANID